MARLTRMIMGLALILSMSGRDARAQWGFDGWGWGGWGWGVATAKAPNLRAPDIT